MRVCLQALCGAVECEEAIEVRGEADAVFDVDLKGTASRAQSKTRSQIVPVIPVAQACLIPRVDGTVVQIARHQMSVVGTHVPISHAAERVVGGSRVEDEARVR